MNNVYQYCTKCGKEAAHKMLGNYVTCLHCGHQVKVLERTKEEIEKIKAERNKVVEKPSWVDMQMIEQEKAWKQQEQEVENCIWGTGARVKGMQFRGQSITILPGDDNRRS